MTLDFNNIRFVPIVHQRVTFAERVRHAAISFRPDAIAVELPATLQPLIVEGVKRLPRISAIAWREAEDPNELYYLPIDPSDGLVEAVRLALGYNIPLHCIDLDLPGLREKWQYAPDDLIVERAGLKRYVEEFGPALAATDDASAARESHMATMLRALAGRYGRVLCVLGVGHYESVRRLVESGEVEPAHPGAIDERPGAALFDIEKHALPGMLGEIPWLTYLWEQSREERELTGEGGFDRLDAIVTLLREAADVYEKLYHEQLNLTQWHGLLQYARNLALVNGRLQPDFHELVIAGRGVVDGDYAAELAALGALYPPQEGKGTDELPRLTAGRGLKDDNVIARFHAAPRWEMEPFEMTRIRLRRRPPAELLEIWKRDWEEQPGLFGLCDWPPESERQEKFMHFVRKRALAVMSEDRRRVEEFTSSMLDGLDLRETLRNWHSGKLYVRAEYPPRGAVGAVVVIFEDQDLDDGNNWRATLYAEHRGESDISFFATPLGEQVVGPRISRVELNGLLSVWPASHLPDIWMFNLGEGIKSCADALLASGIMFSSDKYVAYVAATPPRPRMKQLARRYGRHIIYLPLHQFARDRLRRIRRFHMLGGRHVRRWARDYIFEN
ncbi:hypothetical protein LLG95_15550 [bacterium]|nr:hypothetical protein [bacterium]